MMRYKNLFWGILFMTIGVLWLLQNLQIVSIGWSDVWPLWPFILVWTGISVIPIKDIYRIILDVIALAIAIFVLLMPHTTVYTEKESFVEISNKVMITEPMDSLDVQTATLSLETGAGKFVINQGNELVKVLGVSSKGQEISIRQREEDMHLHADVDLKIFPLTHQKNEKGFEIQLNPTPVWDMDLDLGAIQAYLDMSMFKVKDISVNAGVSDIYLKIGSLYPDVNVDVSTGVSTVKIEVPTGMPCVIHNESALADMDFKGFQRESKGLYVADGQDSLKGNINIHIETGVSNVKVIRY